MGRRYYYLKGKQKPCFTSLCLTFCQLAIETMDLISSDTRWPTGHVYIKKHEFLFPSGTTYLYQAMYEKN